MTLYNEKKIVFAEYKMWGVMYDFGFDDFEKNIMFAGYKMWGGGLEMILWDGSSYETALECFIKFKILRISYMTKKKEMWDMLSGAIQVFHPIKKR